MTASQRDATCAYGALFGSEIKVTFILLRGLSLLPLSQYVKYFFEKTKYTE